MSSIEVHGSTNPNVRVVNVLRDASAAIVDVYIDAEESARIKGLKYLEYSSEESVGIGVHTIVVVAAGGSRATPIRTASIGLSADSSYTVFVLGSGAEIRVFSRETVLSIGNDSLVARAAQVTSAEDSMYMSVAAPAGVPVRGFALPAFDMGQGRWGDSIGIWGELRLLAGKMLIHVQAKAMNEVRQYSGSYREGSVVTFFVIGEYGGGSGDLGVYSLVESDSGGGMLHRLREKGVGDGAVRAVIVASDLYRSRVTIAGAPASGGSNVRYNFNQRLDDHLGSFNAKYMRNRVVGNSEEYDTLIDEDLYVGADTLTTAILVGTEGTGYSVVSLATPLVYQVSEARSRLRVFHGSSSVGPVDVVFKLSDGSIERFNEVSYKGSSEYRELLYGPVVAELYRSGEQVAFARKRGYLPVDSQMTLMVIGGSADSLGIALLVDTDSNYQAVNLWPEAGATGVGGEEGITGESKGLNVMVYPNPSHDNVQVSFWLEQRLPVQVEVCTMTGIVKMSGRPQEYEQGNNEITLPIGALPAGPYLVRLSTGNQATVRLVTIVR
ncbi:MAG: T9SS type A sorting domain-containing protein [Chlorobi bacterium]|nr:T9SS type A sorting domain-containing protein [Chlorobiota bacterium]